MYTIFLSFWRCAACAHHDKCSFSKVYISHFYSKHLPCISVWRNTDCFLTRKGRLCSPVTITQAQSYLLIHALTADTLVHSVRPLSPASPSCMKKNWFRGYRSYNFSRQASDQCSLWFSLPFFSCCVTARRVILTPGMHFTTDGRDLQNLDLHFTSTWESQLWVTHSPKAIDPQQDLTTGSSHAVSVTNGCTAVLLQTELLSTYHSN